MISAITLVLLGQIGEIWWKGVPSDRQDWLNKSFTEYSGMMLVRAIYGEEEFEHYLTPITDMLKIGPILKAS